MFYFGYEFQTVHYVYGPLNSFCRCKLGQLENAGYFVRYLNLVDSTSISYGRKESRLEKVEQEMSALIITTITLACVAFVAVPSYLLWQKY